MEPIICPEKYRVIDKDNIIVRKKVSDWLYILDEVNCTYMYLIIGKEKALLIDAGYGFTQFRHLIDEVTDLPLTVVCTHGHDDHVLGCTQFPQAYLNERDFDLLWSNDNPVQKEKQIVARRESAPDIDNLIDKETYCNTSLRSCEFLPVSDGDVFDLGGITLQVYPIPGHTKGSIALYCPEKKAIFTGDTVMKNHRVIYSQALEISAPPQEFIAALTRIEKLDIETVWPAHGNVPVEPEYIGKTRELLIDWAHHGDIEKDRMTQPTKSLFGKPGQPRPGLYYYQDIYMSYHQGHLEQIHEFMAEHDGTVE